MDEFLYGAVITGLVCRCSIGSSGEVVGTGTVAAGVVLSLATSDLSKSFQASTTFGDGSAASKAAIALILCFAFWQYGKTRKTMATMDKQGKMSKGKEELRRILQCYRFALFPSAFSASSFLEGIC
ncbi:MAG: hypothetical protein EOP49_32825, partial [Sphingobacteriales bacterium]